MTGRRTWRCQGDANYFTLSTKFNDWNLRKVHSATCRLSVSAQPLYTRPVSRDSMAQPTADPNGNIHDKKLTSEESRRTPGYKETSTETSPSRTNAEDTGVVSIRSLSEREDSAITSSADETVSLSILSRGAATDEVQTSVRSTPDVEVVAAGAPSCSDNVKSVEASVSASPSVQAHYYVKWITWKGEKTPIITQSENGPCPLLAIMNILFLRWKAKLPPQTEVITIDELMAHLGECVLCIKPQENAEGMELNFQQNMSDVMAVLPKLSTGLDVNVRFTGVADFEYTPECIVFDLLDVPLYHGWLVDPQSLETASAVGKLTYNQLVEKIIVYKHSTDSNQVSEGLIAEQFLESTATQLTYHGLCELNTTANEGELCVFFRNNHFSTMNKHKGHLYLLVTDQGFLQEDTVVWESLHNVEGDGNFCDSGFRLSHPSQKSAGKPLTQQQIDQDYMVAMSLQQSQGEAPGAFSDLELATRLQQEEYEQPQRGAAEQQTRGSQASHPGGRRRQAEKKDTSDCSIL